MQAHGSADLELERRLDDFARARLTPDGGREGADARPGDARGPPRVRRPGVRRRVAAMASAELDRRSRPEPAGRRRGARRALLAAAVLSLIAVGGALAASERRRAALPGPRLDRDRHAAERSGAPAATAELTRLESRMAELEAAVRSGDRVAAAAALAAYEQIADEALAGAGGRDAGGDRQAPRGPRPPRRGPRAGRDAGPGPGRPRRSTANIETGDRPQRCRDPADRCRPERQRAGAGGTARSPAAGPAAKPEATPQPEPTPRPDAEGFSRPARPRIRRRHPPAERPSRRRRSRRASRRRGPSKTPPGRSGALTP